MLIDDINRVMDIWIKALEHYDFIQLSTNPSPKSWSIGQVYTHLINDTNYYIDQIKICASTNDNSTGEMSHFAKAIFFNNDFPDEAIEGATFYVPQPANKEELVNCLMDLKGEISKAEKLISLSSFKGKTKHPGFNYFNAIEWLQFTEMHLRHHLRQKKRIDDFLVHK